MQQPHDAASISASVAEAFIEALQQSRRATPSIQHLLFADGSPRGAPDPPSRVRLDDDSRRPDVPGTSRDCPLCGVAMVIQESGTHVTLYACRPCRVTVQYPRHSFSKSSLR